VAPYFFVKENKAKQNNVEITPYLISIPLYQDLLDILKLSKKET